MPELYGRYIMSKKFQVVFQSGCAILYSYYRSDESSCCSTFIPIFYVIRLFFLNLAILVGV